MISTRGAGGSYLRDCGCAAVEMAERRLEINAWAGGAVEHTDARLAADPGYARQVAICTCNRVHKTLTRVAPRWLDFARNPVSRWLDAAGVPSVALRYAWCGLRGQRPGRAAFAAGHAQHIEPLPMRSLKPVASSRGIGSLHSIAPISMWIIVIADRPRAASPIAGGIERA
jgi:hypothetical protein